jgi:hypothetical protein
MRQSQNNLVFQFLVCFLLLNAAIMDARTAFFQPTFPFEKYQLIILLYSFTIGDVRVYFGTVDFSLNVFDENHQNAGLVNYDFDKTKGVLTFDLSKWNLHQGNLDNVNLWLISKNDG